MPLVWCIVFTSLFILLTIIINNEHIIQNFQKLSLSSQHGNSFEGSLLVHNVQQPPVDLVWLGKRVPLKRDGVDVLHIEDFLPNDRRNEAGEVDLVHEIHEVVIRRRQ